MLSGIPPPGTVAIPTTTKPIEQPPMPKNIFRKASVVHYRMAICSGLVQDAEILPARRDRSRLIEAELSTNQLLCRLRAAAFIRRDFCGNIES